MRGVVGGDYLLSQSATQNKLYPLEATGIMGGKYTENGSITQSMCNNFNSWTKSIPKQGLSRYRKACYNNKKIILSEFLKKYRAEAKKMSIYEYYEERQRRFDKEEGREEGEERLASLMKVLFEKGKDQDVVRIASDVEYRKELYKKYNL